MSEPTVVRMMNSAYVVLRGRFERRLPFLPHPWIERLQRRRLRAIMRHAYRTVPFYRDAMRRDGLRPADFRTADDLSRLPLIDGAFVYHHADAFLSTSYRPQDRYALFSTGTSSTGSKRILWDRRALFRQLIYGERDRIVLYHLLGKMWGQQRLSLFPAESSTAEVTRFHRDRLFVPPIFARTESLSSQATYEEVAQRINELRPDVVYSYGSIAEGFFRHVAAHETPLIPPRVWVYGGDALSDEDRTLIEEHYGCRVHSTYQAVEVGRIGFRCEERDGFHLNVDLCPVRIVDANGGDLPPGQVGEVVVSNLYNRAMVLLNYRIGDVGALSVDPCPCGRSLPVLRQLEGRSSSTLHLADGREILDHVLTHAYKDVLESAMAFQIVQRQPGDFVLRIVAAPRTECHTMEERILSAARRVLGEGNALMVEFVDRIEPGPRGKHQRVVQLNPAPK
jgi:phenylacetate-CoA ligase